MLRPKGLVAHDDTDLGDIRAFQYFPENYDYPNLASEFFPATEGELWPAHTLGRFAAFGFPSDRQVITCDDRPLAMVAHRLAVGGRYDGKSSSAELHRLKLDGPISADGMSGGPVFHLGREGDQFFAGWAGMVVRGGNQSEYLHFVAASFIVDWVLRSPVTETIPRK